MLHARGDASRIRVGQRNAVDSFALSFACGGGWLALGNGQLAMLWSVADIEETVTLTSGAVAVISGPCRMVVSRASFMFSFNSQTPKPLLAKRSTSRSRLADRARREG